VIIIRAEKITGTLKNSPTGHSCKRSKNSPPHNRRLRLEPLEDRRMLAITVDSLVDEADGSIIDGSIIDGDISLRDAISAATADETIDFSVNGTINLERVLG
jgi:hypothetical protein